MDLSRREFGTLVGELSAVAMLPVPDRADRAHVRYLQSALTQLRAQARLVGGGTVLPQALQYFAHVRRMLHESDYSAPIGRELLVVATDFGIESAWFAYDADNQQLARQLYGHTALLADSADVSEQRVHLYVSMVQQCVYLAKHTGQPGFAREGLRFSARAADAARHEHSPALHALIAYRESLAHAQLGDGMAFRSAITTARRELDRGPHDTDPTWTSFVSQAEITGYEAMGKAQLGAPAQAVRLWTSVLDRTSLSPRHQANARALLAETLVATGDLGQAIEHGLMVLPDLGRTMTSGRVLQRLRPVREAASPAKAAEFCEKFDAAAHALHTA